MKKILLTLLMLLVMSGVGHAALTQVIAVAETTTSSITVETDYTVDGDVATIYLYFDAGSNIVPTTLQDSILQSDTPTDPDSFVVTGLTHNTAYSFFTVIRDSIYAHAESIYVDTSDIASVSTEGIVFTNTAEEVTYRAFQIHIEMANLDSAAKKIVLEYAPFDTVAYSRMDSVSTDIDNADDTLATPDSPTDVLRNTYYKARIIATDSTGTDTSDIVAVLTADFDWGTWGQPVGWVKPNLYHVKHSWTSSAATLTLPFDISDKSWVKIWAKLIGLDNNEANDSAYVYLASYAHGAQVFGDTLIAADVDTGRIAEDWVLKPLGSIVVDTLVREWGTDLVLKAMSSSGDTTTIDERFLEVWLMFR